MMQHAVSTTETESQEAKKERLNAATSGLLKHDITFEESQKLYKKWAEDQSYDELLWEESIYGSPHKLASTMKEIYPDPKVPKVLDIGAGTGLIGELLNKAGFNNIHALEPVQEFVDTAQAKGIYSKFYIGGIGGGAVVDCPDETYDTVTACGVFAPSHIPYDCLHEVVRVLKPGGYFVNCMRLAYLDLDDYHHFEPLTNKLEVEGKWRKVKRETYPNHLVGNEGLVMVYQVC